MKKQRSLAPLPQFHPDKIPPKGATASGTTAQGEQIYKETSRRSRGVPMFDDKGDRVVMKAPNGDIIMGRNRMEVFELELRYTLESEGNGNIRREPVFELTREQKREIERRTRIEQMKQQLAEVLVDTDTDPRKLAALLAERELPEPKAEAGQDVEYPAKAGVGLWELSDGSKIRGSKAEAKEAEAALVALREAADRPSF